MAINKTQILQAAQSYMAKGQIDRAIEEWQKLISESPNDGNIYNTIGDLYLKKNATQQAIDAYLKAAEAFHTAGFALKTIAVYKKILKINPKRYDIYIKLGDVNNERGLTGNAIEDYLVAAKHYSHDGRIKEALDVYRKIADLDPTNTSIRIKLAELCLKEGYEEQAVAEYLQAASAYTEAGQSREAEALYEHVLKLDPHNEVARIALGMVPGPDDSVKRRELLSKAEEALEKGIYDQAEHHLRQLITMDPAHPLYHEKLGYLLLKKGQQFTAFTALKSAAQGYLKANEAAQAARLMMDYLAVDPGQIEAHQILAMALEKQGDQQQAIQQYARAIDEYLAMGDPTQAQPIYERIKALSPEHRDVKRLRLVFEGRTFQTPSASISVEPTITPALEGVSQSAASEPAPAGEATLQDLLTEAEVYFKYGLVSKAVEQLEQVLARDPENVQAHLRLKEIYEIEGLKSQAAEECLKLAAIYKRRQESEALQEIIEEARQLNPDHPALQEQTDRARPQDQSALEASPPQAAPTEDIEARIAEDERGGEIQDYETHYHLGLAYKEMGLISEAIEEFSLSVSSPDHSLKSRTLLSACYQQKGMVQEAIQVLEEALADPGCGEAERRSLNYDLALLFEQNGRLEEALQRYTTIYDEDRNFKDVGQRLEALRMALGKTKGEVKASRKSRISYL